jgi:para-aminobenzoate synthetase component 1
MTTEPREPILCRVHFRTIPGGASLSSLTKIIAGQSQPAILGGNSSVQGHTIFSAEPVEDFEFKDGQEKPFEQLQTFLEKYKLENISHSIPDRPPLPGWIGFFSYPLAHYIEKLPRLTTDDLRLPLIYLAFYDKMIVYDHKTEQYLLIVLEYSSQRQTVDEKFRQLQTWLDEAAVGADPRVCPNNNFDIVGATGRSPLHFTANMTRDYYFDAIKKIKRHILDGDVYQINFSRRFACDFTAEPVDCFLWQNRHNPSPLSAYLSCADWSVVSASPELFLRIEDNTILTRPIKGTRPRKNYANTEKFNRRQYEELLESEKDRAELVMIVDLERNDLARVCVPGTRYVSRQRTIEAYPTVFHAYADIAGRLPRPNDAALFCDILRAVFPGGSITGAPKIRAMEIIEELEPTTRSLYTGCIGHIGIDFNAALNIAIRTIIIHLRKAYLQTGGGIVADSDPHAEWEEMLLKADALLTGLAAVNVAEASVLRTILQRSRSLRASDYFTT